MGRAKEQERPKERGNWQVNFGQDKCESCINYKNVSVCDTCTSWNEYKPKEANNGSNTETKTDTNQNDNVS